MAILLLPLTLIFIILAYHLDQKLKFNLPPGPQPWPIVGNLYDIKAVRFRCFAELSQAYGPILSVWFGSVLNVIVSNSELAKEVLKDNDQQLANRHQCKFAHVITREGKDLIWTNYGPHYVKVGKVCTIELFSAKRLEALRHIREDEVTAMVESIFKDCTNPGKMSKSLLLKKYLEAVTFNNMTRLAFGKRFENLEGLMDEQGEEFKAIVANRAKLGASSDIAEHVPWLRWLFPLKEEAFAKHGTHQDRLIRSIMEEHMLALQERSETKQHFLDGLLNLQDEYDLSEDTIIGLLWDMVSAGMEQTAISVEWAMAEFIKNSRVQQKAHEELDRVIGHDHVISKPNF